MQTRASDELLKLLAFARDEAMRTGNYVIDTDHLFLGLLRQEGSDAYLALKDLGATPSALKEQIEARLFRSGTVPYEDKEKIEFSRRAQNVLNLSMVEATMSQAAMIFPAHLLLAIMDTTGSITASLLREKGITRSSLLDYFRAAGLLSPQKVDPEKGRPGGANILRIISSPGKIAS